MRLAKISSFILVALLALLMACKARTVSEVKIIHGDELLDHQFPTTGELVVDATRKNLFGDAPAHQAFNEGFCTATLICDDVILTAAHCVEDFFGKPKVFSEENAVRYFHMDALDERFELDWDSPGGRVPHHKFFRGNSTPDISYDAALVKLKTRVPDFDLINRFPLASQKISKTDSVKDTKKLLSIGYSNTVGLFPDDTASHVRRIGEFAFDKYKRSSAMGIKYHQDILSSRFGKYKICHGDSGGALYIRRNGRYEQIAINNLLDEQTKTITKMVTGSLSSYQQYKICHYIDSGLFASIPDLKPWIIENTQKMCSDPSQVILDPAKAPKTEVFQKRSMDVARHIVLYRPDAEDNIKVKCAYNKTPYFISDLYVTVTAGAIVLKYSTYDPTNKWKPWSTTGSALKISKYSARKELEWLLMTRKPTQKDILDFFVKYVQPESARSGHASWIIETCEEDKS